MITLSEAFKLCKIAEEAVYLRHVSDAKNSYYFWSRKIRDKFDMKSIKVTRIDLEFEHFGSAFLGFCFVVDGIEAERLRMISNW